MLGSAIVSDTQYSRLCMEVGCGRLRGWVSKQLPYCHLRKTCTAGPLGNRRFINIDTLTPKKLISGKDQQELKFRKE